MVLSVKGDRMIVVFDPVEEREVKGIVIPSLHHERSRRATVKEVGPEVKGFKSGDRVILSFYTGVKLHLVGAEMYGEKVDEERFRIVREEEILAKIEQE